MTKIGYLQIVVLQDFKQRFLEARDFEFVGDAFDQSQWLDVRAHVLEKSTDKF